MTAIKKTTSKATTSPAPATKIVPPVAKSKLAAAAPTIAPATPLVAPAAKPKPVVAAPVAAPVATPPAVKAAAPKPAATVITAKIDVGFGNALYVRGDGPGLSWEKGLLMTCVTDDQWQITLGGSSGPIALKFLINDATWSSGADHVVPAGKSVVLVPEF